MNYHIVEQGGKFCIAAEGGDTPINDSRFDDKESAQTALDALKTKQDAAANESKSVDLEAELSKIRTAWYELYPSQPTVRSSDDMWIYTILDDALVITAGMQKFRVPYIKTDTGITFAPRVDWQPGEMVQEFLPADMADDPLEVKAMPDGRIRAYAVLWGNEHNTDLSKQKDYFTPRTDFWDTQLPMPRPLTYHHGWNEETKAMPVIGKIDEFGDDDIGRWYIAELDKAHRYEKAVRALVQQRALRSSVDSIPQYARREAKANGAHEIQVYPLFGVTLSPTPMEPRMIHVPAEEVKAFYKSIGVELTLPEADAEAGQIEKHLHRASAANGKGNATNSSGQNTSQTEAKAMTKEEMLAVIREEKEREQKEAEAKAAREKEIETLAEAKAQEKLNALAKERRIPLFSAEAKSKVSVVSKYDDMALADLAFLAVVRGEAKAIGKSHGVDEELARALALKSIKAVEQGKLEVKAMEDLFPEVPFEAKANEAMQSTLAGYGDEWVPTNYSSQLWQVVRAKARLLQNGFIPEQEIPKGYESDTIPLEGSTDFTFYNVGQAANEDSTMKDIPATIPSSKFSTDQRVITVGKLGARGYIPGELDEDSIVDYIPEARRKLEAQMPQELDFLFLNADDTAATDNINGNGTPVAGADYTLFKGIIRNALKNNSAANAYDMGAAITSAKVRALYQTLGADGFYVADDPQSCRVFTDYLTWWAVMGLSDLLTVANAGQDAATIVRGANPDEGILIHGVRWYPSVGVKKAQATGVRHGTEASNTKGRAVLVRGDQWKIRWKRRAKYETVRNPDNDTTKIIVTLRAGIGYRDTEASAIGYNI